MRSSDLVGETILRAELRKQLGPVLDVERLLAKVMIGSAGPRDLLALGKSLDQMPGSGNRCGWLRGLSARLPTHSRPARSVPEASLPIIAAFWRRTRPRQ